MHDQKILAKYGCTPERLREIFTSTGPDDKGKPSDGSKSSSEDALSTRGVTEVPYQGGSTISSGEASEITTKKKSDWAIRCRFEKSIRSRTQSGIITGLNNSKAIEAVKIAWDAPPIQKEMIPLMLWAQGKIKNTTCCSELISTLGVVQAAKYLTKQTDGTFLPNVPRICSVAVNLVRSYTTRRHAAIAALWDNLWPLLKYNPRGTNEVANLRADALTQRVDQMADDYNYRHFLSQTDRDKLLFCDSLIFPRCAWDVKKGIRKKKSNVAGATGSSLETESYTICEGVDVANPPKERWFWDLSAPLANINTNNGPGYIGYWNIVPYGTFLKGNYYNTSKIVATEAWALLVQQQNLYFSQNFDPCVLSLPNLGSCSDPALMNDRTGNMGIYTEQEQDKGVLHVEYFENINPKVEGIGDYDSEIWIRLTSAGDGTIVGAEFMPSIPACYGAINANDNRIANASLAMEMLSWQDMASNIFTVLIEQIRRSFTQLWILNKDVLGKELCEKIERDAKNQEWWLDPQVLACSFSELYERMSPGGGFNLNAVVAQVNVQLNNAIGEALRGFAQLLALADKLVNSSPNELGQPNPREVAAREVQEISTSVQSIYSFYNQGPREQRAAFKKLIYESLICCGSDEHTGPVLNRYQKKTIKDAGFELADPDDSLPDNHLMLGLTRIMGKIENLTYSYYFDSREGAERALNTQGAQILQQFLVGILGTPIGPKLGMKRILTMLNIIARMAGAPDEFQITLNDGESEQIPTEEEGQNVQVPPQVAQAIQQLMQQMQQLAVKDSQLEQVIGAIMAKLGIQPIAQPPGPIQGPSGPVAPPNAISPANASQPTPIGG